MYEELIKALRCGSSPMNENGHDCKNCKYAYIEEVDTNIPVPPRLGSKDGKAFWISCDGDRMMQEAADLLEIINIRQEKKPEETNIDVLRKMSAHQLGKWICNEIDNCEKCGFAGRCRKGHNGLEDWLEDAVNDGY